MVRSMSCQRSSDSSSGLPDRLTGVVDQDVDAAQVLLDLGDEVVDGVQVGQIAGVRVAPSPPDCGDAVDELVEQLLAARDDHHSGAAAGELLGGGLADA